MNAQSSPVPAKTMRTASTLILAFAAALILFGLNMFQVGIKDAQTARELQVSGLSGTVTDARVEVGRTGDGQLHALSAELTFEDASGDLHTMETNHYPRYHPGLSSPRGFVADFPTKNQIVGQPVVYRLGEDPAVVLVSELPDLANQGLTFPSYLGMALTVMSGGAAIGGVISLVRANRRIRDASSGTGR